MPATATANSFAYVDALFRVIRVFHGLSSRSIRVDSRDSRETGLGRFFDLSLTVCAVKLHAWFGARRLGISPVKTSESAGTIESGAGHGDFPQSPTARRVSATRDGQPNYPVIRFMTSSITTYSNLPDSAQAGEQIGERVRSALNGASPDALIVFASSKHDYGKLLQAIDRSCRPKAMVGCSSAGEFTNDAYNEGAASVVAIQSSDLRFHAVVSRGLRGDRAKAARGMTPTSRARTCSSGPKPCLTRRSRSKSCRTNPSASACATGGSPAASGCG